MPDDDWKKVKNAQPRYKAVMDYKGPKDQGPPQVKRYAWSTAATVKVSGTKFPEAKVFTNVGIIKKSYVGSFRDDKPSLRLDFTKNNDGQGIENLIGTKSIILNNSVQDDSYIRQPLGYELFRQAGLPSARCNFARVIVKRLNAPAYDNADYSGIYVNLEPFKKRFLENNFTGNSNGNLYEIEAPQDIDFRTLNSGTMTCEGYSGNDDLKDLILAAKQLESRKPADAWKVLNRQAFIRFLAMETLLKQWDGYTQNRNNAYLYNDVAAVANPTIDNKEVNLKFIPSGIDSILQGGPMFIGNTRQNDYSGLVALIARNDKETLEAVKDRIREYSTSLFGEKNFSANVDPFINRLETTLKTAGVNAQGDFDKRGWVRNETKGIGQAGVKFVGSKST